MEIPDPIITAEVCWSETGYDEQGTYIFVVEVRVAGVAVTRNAYSDPHMTTEDACEKALVAFGKRLRNLIGEVEP